MINNKAFVTIAGNPEKWDADFRARARPGIYPGTYDSGSVCAIQSDHHSRGFRDAKLCETIYGWSVRAGSGLAGFARLSGSFPTKADAITWGIRWAREDAANREFFAHRSDVTDVDLDALTKEGA